MKNMYGNMCHSQKLFQILFGRDTHVNQTAWSKDAHRGEAGQFAAWLCVEQIVS
jgi:hypothetical protein